MGHDRYCLVPSTPSPRRPAPHDRAPLRAVGSFAAGTVSALVREAPLSAEKLAFAWREAVGPAIARATGAVLSADGCLDVQAASEVWRREIVRSEALIRQKLEAWLGGGVVRSLRVTAPASEPKPRRRRSRG